MITQSCFIRKNTPELRQKLEGLGYKPYFVDINAEDDNDGIIVNRNEGFFSDCWNSTWEMFPAFDTIDCGTDEQLFLDLVTPR